MRALRVVVWAICMAPIALVVVAWCVGMARAGWYW